jgi:carbamoyl-phosphate synthase large subunit
VIEAAKVGYPVVVRPSYVLGGRAMEIVYDEAELKDYMVRAVKASPEHPVLVDRYMQGTEVEVDAISDGHDVFIPGIMEHVERAGVHSGDSIAVYPTRTLSPEIIDTIVDYTTRLARGLNVKGVLNIQYVVVDDGVYVIEVNPRSSRTIPFLSKVTDVPMVNVATRVAMGETLRSLGYQSGLLPAKAYTAVKAPVFSFAKMQQVDISLGPEMKSTGEVMGIDYHYARALYKAITGAGMNIPEYGTVLFTVADKDKEEAGELAKGFAKIGYRLVATGGTAAHLKSLGLTVDVVHKVHELKPDIIQMIKTGKINMVINTLTHGKAPERDGYKIRRATVEHGIPCFTSMDTAKAVFDVLTFMRERRLSYVLAIQDYVGGGDSLA